MSKKKLSIHQQAKLLVQNILNKDSLSANKILQKLIAEAQAEREASIRKILFEQDQLDDLGGDDQDLGDEEGGDDAQGDQGDQEDLDGQESGQDLDGEGEDGVDEAQVDNKIDDALQIQCQINAKRIANMFDTIAELKQALEDKGLDVNSKEFIKSDVSIAYYSDKLQEFQGKTNPGVDQAKLEEALDKIFEALEQLKEQLGVEGGQDVDTDIETPEEAAGDQGEEDTEDTEDTEGEDEDLQGEGEQQDLDQQGEDQDLGDEDLGDEQL